MRVFLVIFLVMFSPSAWACSCLPSTPESEQRILDNSYAIVRARIKKIVPLDQSYGTILDTRYRFELELIESYKGLLEADKNFAVEKYMPSDLSSCEETLPELGDVLDFFISNLNGKGKLIISQPCRPLTIRNWKDMKTNPVRKWESE